MKSESLTIYESWNLEIPFVPARSRLYDLKPIGIGTGSVESLTSYAARLAAAHSLTPAVLLGRTLASFMDKKYWLQGGARPETRGSALGNSFVEHAKAINGVGIIARDWVEALERVTLRNDLSFLTMLPWADVVTQRHLLRSSRAWCPGCYEDWRVNDQVVYEPLLWTFRDIDVCIKHQRRLSHQCQYCDCKLSWLTRCAQPGYCSKCGEWLGTHLYEPSTDIAISDHELEWQIWVAKNLEELIIAARRLPSPPKGRTAQSLSSCINQTSEGIMNRFARLIGKRKNTVWGWQHGQAQIPIDDLLRICNRVGTSLVDFLYADAFVLDDIDLIQTSAVSGVNTIRRSPRHLDPKATKNALLTIFKQPTPVSMKEVAKKIDLNKRLLYKHFPKLCKAISTRHKEYRYKEQQRVRKVIADKINETRIDLHNIGVYPSRRRVAAAMRSKDGNHFMRKKSIENLTLAA